MFNKVCTNYSLLFILFLAFAGSMHGCELGSEEAPPACSPMAQNQLLKRLLLCAIVRGNLGGVRLVVEEHPEVVNEVLLNKRTPLGHAILRGHRSIVYYLVDKGAHIDTSVIEYNGTPLHDAAWMGLVDVAEFLVDAGADVCARDDLGRTPLSEAAKRGHLAFVRFCVAKGAPFDESDDFLNQTPLCGAVSFGHFEVAQYLIEQGACVNARDKAGHTLLHWCRNANIAELLISHGAAVNAPNEFGATPLHEAACTRSLGVAEVLLRHGAFLDENYAQKFLREAEWLKWSIMLQGTEVDHLPEEVKLQLLDFVLGNAREKQIPEQADC